MVDICLCTIFAPLFLILVIFIWKLQRAGIFDPIEVSIVENPPFLSKSITVYYKYCVGAYKRVCGQTYSEVASLVPKGSTLFGIFYDNPEEVREELLQSALGIVYGEGDKDQYSQIYGEQLTRWGYEKMVLQPVEKAVCASQKFDGMLSVFALKFLYGKMNNFCKENKLDTKLSVEFCKDGKVHVLMPLDHQKDFIVPEVLSLEEVEAKIARKKFDSEEEDSHSDTEIEEKAEELDAGELEDEELEEDLADKKRD